MSSSLFRKRPSAKVAPLFLCRQNVVVVMVVISPYYCASSGSSFLASASLSRLSLIQFGSLASRSCDGEAARIPAKISSSFASFFCIDFSRRYVG